MILYGGGMRSRVFWAVVCCFLGVAGCGAKEPLDVSRGDVGREWAVAPAVAAHPEVEQIVAQARGLWLEDVCSSPKEAVALLDHALELAPGYPAALALRGLARSELGQREQAFDDLTEALRHTPTAQMYAWRGLVSLRGDMSGAARRDAEYALQKDGRQPDAWNVLGLVEAREGDNKNACMSLERGCENGRCRPLEAARQEGICK